MLLAAPVVSHALSLPGPEKPHRAGAGHADRDGEGVCVEEAARCKGVGEGFRESPTRHERVGPGFLGMARDDVSDEEGDRRAYGGFRIQHIGVVESGV